MQAIKLTKLPNQGFCYGVKRAIKIAREASLDPTIKKPIYLLGSIVHNKHVQDYITSLGIILVEGYNRLEMLDKIPNGSTVLFSAHGVSDKVRKKALHKNLHIIDSTCPYVEQTFSLVEKHAKLGRKILFIGKPNHPETEAVLELSENVLLVNPKNIKDCNINCDNPLVAHQTTMSCYDINNLFKEIKDEYKNAEVLDMICRITEKRQNDLYNLANIELLNPSLIIVIGDKTSNNSTKLFELAQRCKNSDAIFVESVEEINLLKIKKYQEIIIASGTSTPPGIINEITNIITNIDKYNQEYIKSTISLDAIVNE